MYEKFSDFVRREKIGTSGPRLILIVAILALSIFALATVLELFLLLGPLIIVSLWGVFKALKNCFMKITISEIEVTTKDVRIVRNNINLYGLITFAKPNISFGWNEIFGLLLDIYKDIQRYSDRYFIISTERGRGVYDADKEKIIVDTHYDWISFLENDKQIICKQKDSYSIFDFDGKLIMKG